MGGEITLPKAPDSGDLGHEICNLVQVIDGYLELASRESMDAAVRRYLTHARTAAEQLVDLSRLLPPDGGPGTR
jgi:hypothetical protein